MEQFTEDDEQVVLDEISRLLIINLMTYYEFLHEKTSEFDDDPLHLDRV